MLLRVKGFRSSPVVCQAMSVSLCGPFKGDRQCRAGLD